MARYTSNRFKDIVIGLPNYSEIKTALQVVGRVGIGTNDAKTPLWIEGNTHIAGIITATVFKKDGGTSSQFLMADGSTNSLAYLTAESDTLDSVLARGNSTSRSIVVDQITANNVSVAQTLTYEDVTSVDSVGMVTARSGVRITDGGLVVTAGVSTFSAAIEAEDDVTVDGELFVASNIKHKGDTDTYIEFTADKFRFITGGKEFLNVTQSGASSVVINEQPDYDCDFRVEGISDEYLIFTDAATDKVGIGSAIPKAKLDVAGDFNVSGVITATSFSGSGANLTNVVTTDAGGETSNLVVTGISSLGIATSGESTPGKTDLYYQGDLKLKTTNAGVQVLGIMSATALDFTGATGAFNNDVLLQGATANVNWDKSHSFFQFFDGAKAVFGSEPLVSDLEIYHNGQNSFINEIGTGELFITTGIGTTAAKVSDGSITLYHQGVERLKTTSSGVVISGSISGSLSGAIDGNASTASDLAINATQQLVIQTGNNATDVFASGTAGQVLQSNGSGNAPTWEAAAPANAISGLTIRNDGTIVGTANSVSTLNFAGTGIAVTFTNPSAGIATVTISGGSDASSVMMSMIF